MIDDFKSDKRSVRSLQAALDERLGTAATVEPEIINTSDAVATSPSPVPEPMAETIAPPIPKIEHLQATRTKHHRLPKLALSRPSTKKDWIEIVVLVLLIAGAGSTWALTHPKAKPAVVSKSTVVIKKVVVPVTVPSALSGLPVNPNLNLGPVTGVMIENSQDARPQSGLSQASVVFEAIAEGGITRFLALYQDTAPDNIGPIRSARPYYLQWALGFDASYAHVGGSPEAIADIINWGVHDLDQFYNGNFYHRVTSRAAPHNVYTAIATLNQLEANKGYTSSNFTSFSRKVAAPAKLPTAKTINLTLSGPDFNVVYQYDATTNSYLRSEGGVPQTDANTNAQISPKVVIAMVMPYSLEADGQHSVYATIGSGAAYIFEDGLVYTGQWAKSSSASQFSFTDSNGAVIKLNPGQTWLTAISNSTTNVSYSP